MEDFLPLELIPFILLAVLQFFRQLFKKKKKGSGVSKPSEPLNSSSVEKIEEKESWGSKKIIDTLFYGNSDSVKIVNTGSSFKFSFDQEDEFDTSTEKEDRLEYVSEQKDDEGNEESLDKLNDHEETEEEVSPLKTKKKKKMVSSFYRKKIKGMLSGKKDFKKFIIINELINRPKNF